MRRGDGRPRTSWGRPDRGAARGPAAARGRLRTGRRWSSAIAGTTLSSARPHRPCGRSRSYGRCPSPRCGQGSTSSTSARTSTVACGCSSLGPAGTRITLTHGEALDPDGDVAVEHLRPDMPFLPEPLGAGQVDVVVSAGIDGDVFEPRLHHARVPVRPGRGPPRTAHRRRHDRGRGPHRPRAARLLRLQRRPLEPAPRGGRLVASAATPATSRPTARPASGRAGPATGSCTSRRRRTSMTSPASRRSGCATSWSGSGRTATSATWRRCRSPSAPGSWRR